MLGGCSVVPVISTLWPTCGVSFASSASRRYSLNAAVLREVVPAVPVVPLVLMAAFVRRNLVSLVPRFAADLPLVPVVACSARWIHPVTVMIA